MLQLAGWVLYASGMGQICVSQSLLQHVTGGSKEQGARDGPLMVMFAARREAESKETDARLRVLERPHLGAQSLPLHLFAYLASVVTHEHIMYPARIRQACATHS
jgi:hypothetical protein